MGHLDPPPPRTQRRNLLQRRHLVGTSILLTLAVLVLLCYTRSSPTSLSASLSLPPNPFAPMAHPDSALPSLTHPRLLADLPSSALPKPDKPGRLIVIGDVHGQLSALDALLAKTGYDAARGDRVVFAGDMVNKGPDSAGVVSRAMEIGAYAVRGNHEDRVLRAWRKMHRKGGKGGRKHATRETETEMERRAEEESSSGEEAEGEEEEVSKSSALDRSTAATLTTAQVAWLAKLPVILRVGTVAPRYGDVIVVHAGLVPGVPLEEQDPWAVMNMRTLISRPRSHSASSPSPDSNSATNPDAPSLESLSLSTSRKHAPFKPSEGREGRPWAKVWNEAQKEDARTEKEGKGKGKNKDKEEKGRRTTVIYGHDAKVGLSIRRYAFGLDSSCVKGGDLTALVFESVSASTSTPTSDPVYTDQDSGSDEDEDEDVREQAKKNGITHRIVSVPCEDGTDDGKGGKGEKKKDESKHKDKGKDEKKHKDHK
ncbi:Metallo-dependent phosphatase [Annulohypoxylon truncatum]|uniref:Metallo-dependent phosphatase n=1 Tax=Annulohypoxylon truncatum TaxID=327061 RepID=UPI002008EA7E|nr:Metallo-dependent phosphatase [Annulohypoxylon truncatum]KAI1206683.1 Metallo-dependent phosphatase [Annulohypoxylon truncatum]